jgi:hypothetical protein
VCPIVVCPIVVCPIVVCPIVVCRLPMDPSSVYIRQAKASAWQGRRRGVAAVIARVAIVTLAAEASGGDLVLS